MEEQPGEMKNHRKTKKARISYAALAAVIFAISVTAISILTLHTANNHKAARTALVRITKTGFEPATISVKKGTKVIWTNTDSGLHQVASNPYPKDTDLPGLKSEILNNTQAYEYTANTTGTFSYHDQLNPTINGTLVVQKK